MRLSEYIAKNRDAMEWTEENYGESGYPHADGRPYLIISIESSMLPGVVVDTYQCFNGDSWLEGELDYLSTEGVPEWLVSHPAAQRADVEVEWDDFDFKYDHKGILEDLADAAVDSLVQGYALPQIFTEGEVTGTFSPAFYNFQSDSFTGKWTIDTEVLIEELGDIDVAELEAWARDRWESRDGFHSHIPRYFDDEHEWAIMWAAIAKVLIDHDYDGLYDVAEAEHEIYSGRVTMTPEPSFYAKIYAAVMGRDLPEDVEVETAEELVALLPEWQEETLPITV